MDEVRIGKIKEYAVLRIESVVYAPNENIKHAAEIILIAVIRLMKSQVLVQCQGVDVVLSCSGKIGHSFQGSTQGDWISNPPDKNVHDVEIQGRCILS